MSLGSFADIHKQMEADQQESQQRRQRNRQPIRFGLKNGESAEVIFVDYGLDDAFTRHEHKIQPPGPDGFKHARTYPCLRETGHCPLCAANEQGREDVAPSQFMLAFSIIDTRPFTSQKTGKTSQFRKVPLVLRSSNSADVLQAIETACRNNDNQLRGIVLTLHRGLDKQSARHGSPAAFPSGMIYEIADESELEADFMAEVVLRQDGSVAVTADYHITPFDWGETFPAYTEEELRNIAGTAPILGSTSYQGAMEEGASVGRRVARRGARRQGVDTGGTAAPNSAGTRNETAPVAPPPARRTRRRGVDMDQVASEMEAESEEETDSVEGDSSQGDSPVQRARRRRAANDKAAELVESTIVSQRQRRRPQTRTDTPANAPGGGADQTDFGDQLDDEIPY